MQPKRDNELLEKLKKQMESENISDEMKKFINSLISKYESVTFKEWSDKNAFFADSVSDMVNDFSFDHEALAKAMARDHNTLQQNYMRLFQAFVGEMAAKTYSDGRNQASVQLAKDINDKVKEAHLPYV